MLPAEVHYFTGGYLPTEVSRGWAGEVTPLVSPPAKPGLFRKPKPSVSLPQAIQGHLQEHNIRAVLAQYGPSGVEMMPICKKSGIPLIVHFHGYDAYRNDMLAAFGSRYKALFQQAAAIIAVSKHMQKHLIKLGAPAEKVYWIPCGPDENLFTECIPSQNPPHFIAVGRFSETKSPHLTLLAFKKVLSEIPQAKLVFCGTGHLEQACIIMAEALGISQQVTFKGIVPHAEIPGMMAQARAFVQHSISTPENDIEGTPVSIQEAGLVGLPVVATLHAGIPDVIINGETGFLVKEMDINGMAKAMIKLAKEPDIADKMGNKSHSFIRENFSLTVHLEKLWKVIEAEI